MSILAIDNGLQIFHLFEILEGRPSRRAYSLHDFFSETFEHLRMLAEKIDDECERRCRLHRGRRTDVQSDETPPVT